MDLKLIGTFVHVAWQGGFNRAAIALNVSQSTTSTRIARLEEELGKVLFNRRGSHIELTEEGQVFLAFAEKMLGLKSEALIALDKIKTQEGPERALRLGSNNMSAVVIVPSAVKRYQEIASTDNARINVLVEGTRALMPALMEGAAEIAFVNPDLAHSHCNVLWYFESQITLVAHPGHRYAGEKIQPADLIDEQFVTCPLGPVSQVIKRLEGTMGKNARTLVESNDSSLICSLVEFGVGLSFLPRACVSLQLAEGTLAEVTVEGFQRFRWETVLVRWRERQSSPEAELFLSMLREPSADGKDRPFLASAPRG